MPFTWKDLRVNTQIVRTIVRKFLPNVGIVLLASGRWLEADSANRAKSDF